MNRKLVRYLRILPKLTLTMVILFIILVIVSQHVRIEVVAVKREAPTTEVIKQNTDIKVTTSTGTTTVSVKQWFVSTNTTSNTTKRGISFDKIINPHPYRYLRLPSGVCKSNRKTVDPFLLILVKSNVFQFGHRIAIRSTWGNFSNETIQIAFLLGFSPLVKPFAKMEYDLYQDIIQEDFLDEYKNNTLKTIMGFNWATSNCKQTKYILFVDDDYFVNIENVLDFVDNISNSENQTIFVGFKYENAKPRRKKDSKWYVSRDDYPDKYWPPYISGGSMLVSMDVVVNMTKAFPYVKHLYIDDVYLGIVADLLNITVSHDKRFETKYIPSKLQTLLSSHEYGSPHNLIRQWKDVYDDT